tara:strand:- start:1042 stop:1260 length:219 start_codon:yes stop_codon:yes gene_type:complete
MSNNFLTCKNCDFEWHRKDGTSCPICTNKKKPETNNDYRGGMFGTGENAERLKKYYQALGIIALVYILYLVF